MRQSVGYWLVALLLLCPVQGESQTDSGVATEEDSGGEAVREEGRKTCDKVELFAVGGTRVWKLPAQDAFFFMAGMTIDANGAPDAYHPKNNGLDDLANAGNPGIWWALVTDNGKLTGNPIVQGVTDPAPGYYVSTTMLEDGTKNRADLQRYVNSKEVPYVALPSGKQGGAVLGDFAVVINGKNGKRSSAIFADLGPKNEIGGGSIALAKALTIDANPRYGGARGDVIYLVFPRSGNRKPRPVAEIDAEAEQLFAAWGGMEQIQTCFPEK